MPREDIKKDLPPQVKWLREINARKKQTPEYLPDADSSEISVRHCRQVSEIFFET
jgi:hypothetical protein